MNFRKVLVCFVLPTLVFAFALTFAGVLTINASKLGAAGLGAVFSLVYFGLQYPMLRSIIRHYYRTGDNVGYITWVWEPIAFVITASLIALAAGSVVDVVSTFSLFVAAVAYKVLERLAINLLE